MENLNKISKLLQNANAIKGLFESKLPSWKEQPSYYDKVGAEFNNDSRFKACEGVGVYFSSWMGTYGDSGCSRQLDLDKEIFSTHLIKVLNKNKEAIMMQIADSMREEGKKYQDAARTELEGQLAKINSL